MVLLLLSPPFPHLSVKNRAGLLPTCPHPRPEDTPTMKSALPIPYFLISFLFLMPSHNFLTLLATLKKPKVSP